MKRHRVVGSVNNSVLRVGVRISMAMVSIGEVLRVDTEKDGSFAQERLRGSQDFGVLKLDSRLRSSHRVLEREGGSLLSSGSGGGLGDVIGLLLEHGLGLRVVARHNGRSNVGGQRRQQSVDRLSIVDDSSLRQSESENKSEGLE